MATLQWKPRGQAMSKLQPIDKSLRIDNIPPKLYAFAELHILAIKNINLIIEQVNKNTADIEKLKLEVGNE